ncbi:MAG: aspartate kinase [Nitrososphaera sp.]|uniref:Putative aspartokinase n=1 Tax=Nitrososphaera gargensis (strain Ga9.2) TaxID=1237085 RepID=K0IMI0_NITGG|nr:aspartate kinase [Candidatus Nitrososphaera gargensis]AFU60302.1 putative aspartokinase [Candidatus Nitrososphaera gargensis Ga9.2]
MTSITVAKFGGSALGIEGNMIPKIIDRIRQLQQESKVVAVFSAPLIEYDGKVSSMTDVALKVGRSYAASTPVEIEVLREVYERIASKYVKEEGGRQEFIDSLDKFYRQVIISLKQAAENRRFVDVIRSRTLAYSGEVTMSYLMDYVMQSAGLKSTHVSIEKWPIITDDNFEAANFMVQESKEHSGHLIDLVEHNDVVSMGGFIGRTVDGLETTYERGGSDRTAADIAILLNDSYDVKIDFEKDSAVLSADPRIVKDDLEFIQYLSYNEAKLAGMFGMKILDPIAIKEIDDNNLDIPIVITDMAKPGGMTMIQRKPPVDSSGNDNPIKIVTGKKNCAMVRMESNAASHLVASLELDRQYHDFVKLSPYKVDDTEMTRLLFLDADYVRRYERHFRAYYPKAEIVYGRGVVTLIGDEMWKVPKIASTASSTVSEHDINILNLDAQEETSRILIVVEDKGSSVADAVKAIHSTRTKIRGMK